MSTSAYSESERAEILAAARAHIARKGRENIATDAPVGRRDQPEIIFKTVDNARVEPQPAPGDKTLPADTAPMSWPEWWVSTDAHIGRMIDAKLDQYDEHICESVGTALGNEMRGVDKKIAELEKQITSRGMNLASQPS